MELGKGMKGQKMDGGVWSDGDESFGEKSGIVEAVDGVYGDVVVVVVHGEEGWN